MLEGGNPLPNQLRGLCQAVPGRRSLCGANDAGINDRLVDGDTAGDGRGRLLPLQSDIQLWREPVIDGYHG
jgi:hypothetical protein